MSRARKIIRQLSPQSSWGPFVAGLAAGLAVDVIVGIAAVLVWWLS